MLDRHSRQATGTLARERSVSTELASSYSSEFYKATEEASRQSAAVVVPLVLDVCGPLRSVLDIGCGTGLWLDAFRRCGADEIQGVDGDHLDPAALFIDPSCFKAVDLASPINVGRAFDLVVSLEVGEHLDAASADVFIDSIVRHGELVLFSAAIPTQGGEHHVNEQWATYWVGKFERKGFEVFDVLRPKIWHDDRVSFWYRQNVLLFAKGRAALGIAGQGLATMGVLDVVHPDQLLNKNQVLEGRVPRRFESLLVATIALLGSHFRRRLALSGFLKRLRLSRGGGIR